MRCQYCTDGDHTTHAMADGSCRVQIMSGQGSSLNSCDCSYRLPISSICAQCSTGDHQSHDRSMYRLGCQNMISRIDGRYNQCHCGHGSGIPTDSATCRFETYECDCGRCHDCGRTLEEHGLARREATPGLVARMEYVRKNIDWQNIPPYISAMLSFSLESEFRDRATILYFYLKSIEGKPQEETSIVRRIKT